MVRDDLGRLTREVRSDRTISLEQLVLLTGFCAPALPFLQAFLLCAHRVCRAGMMLRDPLH